MAQCGIICWDFTFALLLRHDGHAHNCKGYCHRPTYCCFDRQFHLVMTRSCVSRASFQKEFPPAAAEIERNHAVDQKRIVVAFASSPNGAQPLNAAVQCFCHRRLNTRSQLGGLWIPAACKNATERSPKFAGDAAGTFCPVIPPS